MWGDVLWLEGHLGRVLKEGAQRDGGQLWGRALPLTRAGGSEQRRDTSGDTLAAQWRKDHRAGTGVGHLGGGRCHNPGQRRHVLGQGGGGDRLGGAEGDRKCQQDA